MSQLRDRDQSGGADVFIASIGFRDPETESGPTGPLRGALELRPARVVLVALPGVEARAEATRQRIAAERPGAMVEIEQLPVDDPADLESLLVACGNLLDRVLVDEGSIAVCASSGTPQLSVALTLAAMARAPQARQFQAADPARTDRPWREFNPDALRHHAELDAAFRMLDECRFQEAKDLLKRRLESGSAIARASRTTLTAAWAIADALDLAGALGPSRAADALNVRTRGLPQEAARRLEDLRGWYAGFRQAGTERNPRWPVELAARAHRQRAAGRIGEALVAAAIAFEVALAVRLRTEHGLDPETIRPGDRARIPLGLQEELRQRASQLGAGSQAYRLEGAQRRSDLLRALDQAYDTLAPAGRVEQLINARNRLVHAAKSQSEERVMDFLRLLGDASRAFGWDDPEECPSSPAALRRLSAALRASAGLAPA